MCTRWEDEIWHTILNMFKPYNGIDVLKLPFLEELYEEAFVVPYVVEPSSHSKIEKKLVFMR